MRNRLLITIALFASATVGVSLGAFVLQVAPPTGHQDAESITGVDTGVDGTRTQQIKGREGIDRTTNDAESIEEISTANDASMQSIRGIRGIDTVMLQNLEAVLRMQAPPTPPREGGGGGGRAAAALLTMENEELLDPEVEPDGREELTEIELDGS